MKAKIATMIGFVLCLNIALQGMVIHNYCEDKEENIRTGNGIFNEDYLFVGNELTFSGKAERRERLTPWSPLRVRRGENELRENDSIKLTNWRNTYEC